ncbi:MAG: fenitrothion hydrolase, partial [Thermoleophilia bacterium]|nr:fenitrothion hydrolase [Thermoleophilia bacterium]
WAATGALVLSFVILAAGGRRIPRVGTRELRATPAWLQRLARARTGGVVAGALGLLWLIVLLATALFGNTLPAANPAPNLVFILGWLGLPRGALLLGRGVLALHPVAALARLGGMGEASLSGRVAATGVWLAWAGLAVFTWLELVYPTATKVRLIAALAIVWVVLGLIAASRWGVRAYREQLDPFGTYARLLASLSPWGTRADGRLGMRLPLLGANRDVAGTPGLVALVTLLIGTVSYDGLTRTGWWQERVALATADLARSGIEPADARLMFGTFGFIALVLLAWGLFEAAAWDAARVGRLRTGRGLERAAQQFAPSLLPIALAYVVAHYFSFFAVQVQDLIRYASDPFDQGWDWFGTADRKIRDLRIPSGTTVWFVQVVSIVVGHVAGLLLAHDRALDLAPRRDDGGPDTRAATRSQVPMLALMLVYTVGGLYFLSEGLA